MQSVLLPPPFSGCIRFLKPATGLQRFEWGENIVKRRLGLTKKKKCCRLRVWSASDHVGNASCFFFVLTLLLSSSACALVLIVNSLHLTPQRIFYCWLFCTMVFILQRGMNGFCSVLPTYYNLKRIFYTGLFIFTHSAVVNSCRSHLWELFQQYGF